MRKLKDYRIPIRVTEKHKFIWESLWFITYILFFPFVIIQILNFLFEEILNFVISLREEIVHTIFKLLFLKECRYYGEESNEKGEESEE